MLASIALALIEVIRWKMGKRETHKQKLLVAGIAILFLAVAALTLGFLGKEAFWSSSNNHSGSGYRNVTFTDAVLECEASTRSEYADRLKSLVVDNHSSRYDDRAFLYKIFFEADMISEDSGEVSLHYVNCFVASESGKIDKFELWEDRDEESGPQKKKTTNAFGYPIK